MMWYQVAELRRQMSSLVSVAKVSEVNPKTARIKVFIEGDAQSDFLPVLSSRASGGDQCVWLPENGDQVLILAPSGEINQGFVVGSIMKTADSPNKTSDYKQFSDGTVVEYDKTSHSLSIDVKENGKVSVLVNGGTVSVKAKDISVEAEGQVSIKASKVAVFGETTFASAVIVEGAMTAKAISAASVATSGAVSADGVDLTSHKHTYIKPLHPDGSAETGGPS
jgi:phage baseplate assembly protein V